MTYEEGKEMAAKYRLVLTVGMFVVGLILVRILITTFTEVTFASSGLFTSVVGGAIFLIAFMLSGTVSDYKESEKLPAELSAAIENLYDEAR